MPSGSNIQQRQAKDIAKKLEAQTQEKSGHEFVDVYVDGLWVTSLGIRRGRTESHGHIPKQLWISVTEALRLGTCKMSRTEWIAIGRAKGKIDPLP